jgi:hypothetical protein
VVRRHTGLRRRGDFGIAIDLGFLPVEALR